MEIIAVSIDGRDGVSCQSLAATFAGFIDSCLRKKMLTCFYQADLLGGALMKLNAAGNY
ncbi:MAG: hypothetical protein NTZ57_05630 [Deltaproteobacteria bacterium]|nr:hypothetical protein [Deltaproteobacteria bacterium]